VKEGFGVVSLPGRPRAIVGVPEPTLNQIFLGHIVPNSGDWKTGEGLFTRAGGETARPTSWQHLGPMQPQELRNGKRQANLPRAPNRPRGAHRGGAAYCRRQRAF